MASQRRNKNYMRFSCSAAILIHSAGFTLVISNQLQDTVKNIKQQNNEILSPATVSVSIKQKAAA
jgi:hypothetical protein